MSSVGLLQELYRSLQDPMGHVHTHVHAHMRMRLGPILHHLHCSMHSLCSSSVGSLSTCSIASGALQQHYMGYYRTCRWLAESLTGSLDYVHTHVHAHMRMRLGPIRCQPCCGLH